MGNFFDDFRGVKTGQFFISDEATKAATGVFGFGYVILKWVWIFLFSFTVISVVVSLVRMAILADDVPMKKAQAKHDFAASMVMLGILGSVPFLFNLILLLLNKGY